MGGMSAQLGCPGVGLGCVDVCVCVCQRVNQGKPAPLPAPENEASHGSGWNVIILAHANNTTMECSRVQPCSLL